MGAQKVGCNAVGAAWREAWTEKVYHEAASGEPFVERHAHKWANTEGAAEEWEEQWGEVYGAAGWVNKWAEKWGKRDADVRTFLAAFLLLVHCCSCWHSLPSPVASSLMCSAFCVVANRLALSAMQHSWLKSSVCSVMP